MTTALAVGAGVAAFLVVLLAAGAALAWWAAAGTGDVDEDVKP